MNAYCLKVGPQPPQEKVFELYVLQECKTICGKSMGESKLENEVLKTTILFFLGALESHSVFLLVRLTLPTFPVCEINPTYIHGLGWRPAKVSPIP